MSDLDVYEAMSTLRAVRRLKPDPIDDEVLERVIEAATWAPTGGNAQPWRMVVVRDPEKKATMGSLYQERWMAFVDHYRRLFAGRPEKEREAQEKIIDAGNYLCAHFAQTPAVVVFCFDPRRMAITDIELDRVSVVGGGSVYPAVQNFLLACRIEGLGCCLTTLLCECEEEIKSLLEIPDEWGTAAVVPIGYPLLGGHGPVKRLPVNSVAFSDRWKTPIFEGAR